MLTAVIGVVGALIFGSADFLGGLAAKRISAILATAVSAVAGLALLLIALPVVGGTWSAPAVLWGGLSGITGAIAISLLYACLAIGPMSILSPLTAVVSAVVPMTAGLLGGDRFSALGYLALALALVAVVLVGFVPEKGAVRPSTRGVLMAIGSGIAIGAFMILIDLTPDDSGLVPLVMNRGVNSAIMFATVGVIWIAGRRRGRGSEAPSDELLLAHDGSAVVGSTAPEAARVTTASIPVPAGGRAQLVRAGILFALACGVIDATANTLLLFGIRIGDLSVMSVLTALYPAGTILLASIVLKERIAPLQWIGLALALTAAGMLALS